MFEASTYTRPKEVEVAGLRVTMSGRDTDSYFTHIDNQIRENHFFALTAKHLIAAPGDAIDIGANIGLTAALFSRARPRDALYAIEPSPTTFVDLKRNVSLNGLTNVQCFQMGLGVQAGRLLMSEDPTNSSAAHLSNPAAPEDESPQAVKVDTLDNFCRLHRLTPRFLKLDVEGHELGVLRGGLETIKVTRPTLFIEMNSFTTLAYGKQSPLDVIGFLRLHFAKTFWIDKNQLRELSTETDLITFLHFHLSRNSGVDDLLCIPHASAVNINSIQAELELLRP